MKTFVYKPGAFSEAQRVEVSKDGLRKGDGPLRAWRHVTEIRFTYWSARGMENLGLTLRFGEDSEHFSINMPKHEVVNFVAMSRAIFGQLEVARPDLEVIFGHAGVARWALFALGLILLGCAGLLAALAADQGLDPTSAEDLGFVAVAAISGIAALHYIRENAPWAAGPRRSFAAMRQALSEGGR